MSTFESTHIHKKTQKAIFEKISALNRQTLGTDTKENKNIYFIFHFLFAKKTQKKKT
jgi:hypothetical protein